MDELVNLPGGAASRRKEIRNRLAALEAKVDQVVEGVCKGSPYIPPPPPPDPLNSLKRRIASDEVRLPGILHCAIDAEGEIIAEALQYGGFNFTIEQLIEFKIMDAKGSLFRHDRAGKIVHAIKVERGEALPGATPGWD
jgi:hypothetical protein